jgi:predicted nucleotide-binding protein
VAYTGPQRDSAAVCSVPNTERLEQMLDEAGFALLVLTAESERTDGVVLARQNVVHEAGLFQGRLGWRKAIVLREDGCEEFSNIAGLGQIPFPNGNIGASFEEVRRVLGCCVSRCASNSPLVSSKRGP